MSHTKTILSYIHQNSPNKLQVSSEGSKEPTTRPNLAVCNSSTYLKPRTPLTRRSFFNDCTDTSLKESKNSIRDSLRYTVRAYTSHEATYYQLRHLLLANDGGRQVHVATTQVPEPDVLPNLRELTRSPSILVKKESLARERFVDQLREIIAQCLRRKLGLTEEQMHTELVKEALTYSNNLLLQDIKSSSTEELCLEFVNLKAADEMRESFDDLPCDFLDKYEILALDHFEDMIFENTTNSLGWAHDSGTLHNPNSYQTFKDIWMLDPPNFAEFDVYSFIEGVSENRERPFAFNSYKETFMNFFGESAVKMNILRYYYTYRNEFYSNQNSKKDLPTGTLSEMPEFKGFSKLVEQFKDSMEASAKQRPRKSLRFADEME